GGLHASASPASLLPFSANNDGWVLAENPLRAMRAGRHNAVPFAIGSNADEVALFLVKPVLSCLQYELDINMAFGSDGPQVVAEYPCLAYLTPQAAEIDALTGFTFTCPARRAARALFEGQAAPVFRYFYTHSAAYGPTALLGAFHASELPYVFAA